MCLKLLITLLVSLVLNSAIANMASPVLPGTWSASPFISQYVDIIRETILITPDERFETAEFQIEYHIKVNQSGNQIPILFYASEFKGGFKVWIDDKEIQLNQVPEAYAKLEGTPFSDFGYFFETQSWTDSKQVHISESPSKGFYVSVDDLKFFKTDLIKGNHIIKVKYIADQWIDKSDWVKEYSFRYVLSPAKYWKSFGTLEVILNNSKCERTLTTSLDSSIIKKQKLKHVWNFSSLPTEVLKISYTPSVSWLANVMLKLKPKGITIILGVVLIFLHFVGMKRFRKKETIKKSSWPLIIGSIFIPLIWIIGYIYTFYIIDFIIGPEASQYHGYTVLVIFLYPFITLLYWLSMTQVDKSIKNNLRK